MHLIIFRTIYTAKETAGILLINDERFCYTLEHPVRKEKIDGITAVPAGVYAVTLGPSPALGRTVPRLHDVPGFEGVLLHGGNTVADSRGCPLIGFTRYSVEKIHGTAEKSLVNLMAASGDKEHSIEIINGYPHRYGNY